MKPGDYFRSVAESWVSRSLREQMRSMAAQADIDKERNQEGRAALMLFRESLIALADAASLHVTAVLALAKYYDGLGGDEEDDKQ